jgi:hypothetical protein
LLVDSMTQPAWRRSIVAAIQGGDFARVALVVRNDAPQPSLSTAEKLRLHRAQLLHLLYRRVDDRLFPVHPDAFAPGDIGPLVDGVPVMGVVPRMTRFCDHLDDATVDAIRAHDVDVAVRFGFRIIKGRFLEVARHGIWSYHHADNRVNRGLPGGFWEVMRDEPVTGAVLQVLTDELDAGRVIHRGFVATDPASVRRNRNRLFWTSAAFLPRRLRELHRDGPDALRDRDGDDGAWTPYSARLYTNPGNGEMLRLAPPFAVRALARAVGRRARPGRGAVLFHLGRDEGAPARTFYRFRELAAPAGRAWHDPSPFARGGAHHVFVAERPVRGGAATLRVAAVGPQGHGGDVRTLEGVDGPHASPLVFAWDGEVHLVARSETDGALHRWRAVDFPVRWEHAGPVLPGADASFPALVARDGRWWLFATVRPPGGTPFDELHLFHAPTPLGPWEAHRRNPVLSDVRAAAPAGIPFVWNGALYRPAADGSTVPRAALAVRRVERMDAEEYRESGAAVVAPDWRPGLTGVRTLSAAGGLTVVGVTLR